MVKAWAVRAAALLALMTLLGFLAVHSAAPESSVIGIWPVGLGTGALILARGRRTPLLLGIVLLSAVGTIWLGGRPFPVAVGYGLGTTLEVWVVWWWFAGAEREWGAPQLRTNPDIARFVSASGIGALLIAFFGMLTSLVTGFGSPPVVGLALALAHLASQLTLLPFFSRLHRHAAVAGAGERAIQWLMIATVVPLVFLPHDFPSVVFAVIPLLGWGALRNGPREALAQMIVVLTIAAIMTSLGLGPFSRVSEQFGLPVDARGMILAVFTFACALVVVPLVLTVGEQIDNARRAAAERDMVTNIVNSATGVAIIGTDETGAITLFNPGAERLLGYQADEVLGRSTTMFHSEEGLAAQARELGVENDFGAVVRAMAAPESAGRDMPFLRKDGEQRTHSMTLSRIVDDLDQVTGYVSTSEDVTERVRAQAALVEALETERRAVEQMREVDQVKDAFVSSVSHELRTPITSIVGYLEMLQDGSFGELSRRQADAVRRVADNSTRLLSLIDDLLTLSRVQDDSLTTSDRVFDLRETVRSGHDVVSPAWTNRALDVSLHLPGIP
ncbi:MAG TPA: histidine kinase dimerization/phospho-acceptor domain-containing protein, partial [Nocardioides sp.]|nr:histidine kinase dimerization/phospho-acceptor domain-containing protein [Nocardioides sp.]